MPLEPCRAVPLGMEACGTRTVIVLARHGEAVAPLPRLVYSSSAPRSPRCRAKVIMPPRGRCVLPPPLQEPLHRLELKQLREAEGARKG